MCRSELKADLEQSGVMVSTRNIRRTPNQDGLNERQLRWTPLLKDRIPRLDWSVLKQAPDKLQSLWQNVWTGDTEIELCRQAEKYTLPTVKHHGSVMLWDCFCCLWWKETYSVLNESRNQRITGAFLQQNGLPSERVGSKIKGPPKHKKYGWTFLKTIHQQLLISIQLNHLCRELTSATEKVLQTFRSLNNAKSERNYRCKEIYSI